MSEVEVKVLTRVLFVVRCKYLTQRQSILTMKNNNHVLLPDTKTRQSKDKWSRVSRFLNYLDEKSLHWRDADIEGFKDALMADENLSPYTVAVYISAVKQAYRDLLKEKDLRQLLRDDVPADQLSEHVEKTRKAIAHATHRDTAKVSYERPETIYHPKHDELMVLIGQIELTSKMDLRDLLVISLILFTGMSEVEVAALTVGDFDDAGGKYIHVPEVSGGKERAILIRDDLFYTPDWWVETYYAWKRLTGIRSGPIFRGFYRGGSTIRKNAMSTVAIQDLIRRYSIQGDNDEADTTLTAQDLRRAYARRLFCVEGDLEAVSDTLGYDDPRTIRAYVGLPDAKSHQDAAQRGDGTQILNQVNEFLDRMTK